MENEYTIAVATDITRLWREKYNYVPASEQPEIKAKHDMFKQHGRDITKDNHDAI